jgi:hypothetical protein
MPATAQLRNKSAVLNWYNEADQSAWEIYRFSIRNSNLTDMYKGSDKEEGYNKLTAALDMIAPDDCENYVLQLINTGKKVKETAPNKVFILNERSSGALGMAYGINPQQAQINNEILNEIRALRAERMEELEEDEDEKVPEPVTAQSILAGMLQQPDVQTMLIGLISGMAAKFLGTSPVKAVAGTHTQEEIQSIINTLFSKGVTPDDLAKLAAMPESQINMLLSMLRK